MKLKHTLLLFVFIALSSFSPTPNASVWENVQLIGANSKSVFSFNLLRYNRGTYYEDIDSLFVVEKELLTGTIIDKKLLRVIKNERLIFSEYIDSMQHVHTEMYSNPFDLIAYQKENDIQFLFQGEQNKLLKFAKEGLFFGEGSMKELVMDKKAVLKFMDIEDGPFSYIEDFHISLAYYNNPSFYILIVDSGEPYTDSDFRQALLPIPKELYNNAQNNYWERFNKSKKKP